MAYMRGYTSGDSGSGGYVFRRRERRRPQEIIIYSDSDSDTDTETETETSEESIAQTKIEDELVSGNHMEIDRRDNEKSEDEDELCVLQDALEAMAKLQGLSQYQKNLMFQKLKTLDAHTRKELTDEWKALNLEAMLLNNKKQTFSAKLANASV